VVGLALALSASVGWGIADFIGGFQSRRLPLLQVMFVSQAIAFAMLAVIVAARGQGAPDVGRLLPAAAGGLAGTIGLTAFYRALAIGTMSVVAPIAATGVCVPVIVGIASGERPGPLQVAGILAAIVGVVLVSRESTPESDHRPIARASIALALMAALGFGSFVIGLRSSARADVLWALVAARGAGTAAVTAAFLVARPARTELRSGAGWLAALGTLDLIATALYGLATRHGLLSLVAVAGSLYPLATVTLARGLLGERVRRSQEIGIAAAVAGIALIAAG
jgi:drug/metabolite transporter (DMT)-like permease